MRLVLGFLLPALLGAPLAAMAQPGPADVCASAPYRSLQPTLQNAPKRAIVPGAMIVPQGDEVDMVMLGPVGPGGAGPDDLQFRVFLADRPGAELPPSAAPVTEIAPLHVEPPAPDLARNLKVDSPKALDLRLVLPEEAGWQPWSGRVIVVVACQRGQAVAYGFRRIEESRRIPSWAIAGGLVLIFYLLAVTMVWLARKRAIATAQKDHVQPPMRITALTPWKWWDCLDPVVLTSDEFDRGSLSNLQVLFFGGLVAFGLTELTVRSGILSNLSNAILYLLGIPAIGALGAGLARNRRDRLSASNWAWLVARGVLPANDSGAKLRPRWSELIMTGTVLDLPKLQALTFSVIVGIAMIKTGFRDFANFNVPTTLLEILGLSQVVFVGGKFTEPTTIGDMDDKLTDLRTRAQVLRKAAASGVDVDPDGKPVPPTAAAPAGPRGPYRTMAEAAAPDAVPNATQRYINIEEEAVVLLRSLFERDVDVTQLADPLTPAA
jgi:hypothetical protein